MQIIRTVGRRKSLRRVAALASMGIVGIAMSACGSDAAASRDDEPVTKVAILAGVGLQDSGLGRATQAGADAIADSNDIDVDVEGGIHAEAWADALRNYASRGYDLVIANDIVSQTAALEVGPEFPDTTFAVVNGFQGQSPNVAAVSFDFEGGGYLAGLAAGVATKTNVVAGIGADESIAPIKALMDGFTAGVHEVNPEATVKVSYTGIPTGDPIKATQQATAVLDQGADVVFGVANDGQPGLFQAAEGADALAIGFGVDENEMAPTTVITSMTIDYAGSILRIFEQYEAGTLGSDVTVEGYDQDVFALADFQGLLTDEQVDEIETAVADATAG